MVTASLAGAGERDPQLDSTRSEPVKQRFGHYPPGSIIGVTINLFRVWPDTNPLCLQTSSSKPQAEAPPPLPHSSQLMLTWALSPVFFLTSCSQDLGRNHPSPVGSRLNDSCGPARKASLMARGGVASKPCAWRPGSRHTLTGCPTGKLGLWSRSG